MICLSREKILMCDFFYLTRRKLLCLFFVLIFIYFFRETLRYPSGVAPVVMETNHYRLIILPYGQLDQAKCSDAFCWFIFLWLDLVKPVCLSSSLSGYRIDRNYNFSNGFYCFTHNFHAVCVFIKHTYLCTHEYLIGVLTQINF